MNAYICMIIGSILFVWTSIQSGQDDVAKNWPACTGTVASHELRKDALSKRERFFPVLHYRYSINDTSYEGETLSFGAPSVSKDLADDKLKTYPVGGSVQVHYDPKNPEKSCLEPGGAKESSEWMTLISVGMMLVGMVMFGVGKIRGRKAPAA